MEMLATFIVLYGICCPIGFPCFYLSWQILKYKKGVLNTSIALMFIITGLTFQGINFPYLMNHFLGTNFPIIISVQLGYLFLEPSALQDRIFEYSEQLKRFTIVFIGVNLGVSLLFR